MEKTFNIQHAKMLQTFINRINLHDKITSVLVKALLNSALKIAWQYHH